MKNEKINISNINNKAVNNDFMIIVIYEFEKSIPYLLPIIPNHS